MAAGGVELILGMMNGTARVHGQPYCSILLHTLGETPCLHSEAQVANKGRANRVLIVFYFIIYRNKELKGKEKKFIFGFGGK